MDNRDKLDLVCKQFGSLKDSNPPMRVDWMASVAWHLLNECESLDGTCLVYLQVENRIGIADRGVKGYSPTPCVIYEGVNGKDAVEWFNQNILGLSPDESMRIVFSTF